MKKIKCYDHFVSTFLTLARARQKENDSPFVLLNRNRNTKTYCYKRSERACFIFVMQFCVLVKLMCDKHLFIQMDNSSSTKESYTFIK